jgi:acyl-CoA synthetase (AMP-forming)/AMP-acid ligase II
MPTVRATVPAGRHPGAASEFTPGLTLPQAWTANWRAHPARPVLIDGADAASLFDGAALERLTAAAAATLAAAGVTPGDRVMWSCAPRLTPIVSLLGALRLGAIVVPVSPSLTASELQYVVGDSTPTAAVVQGEDQRTWLAHTAPELTVLVPDAFAASAAGPAPAPPPLDTATPADDALIVYTSGTTGQPKGALHTHGSLMAGVQALRAAWDWQPDDRLALALPLFHVHGLCAGLFGTLAAGASAVLFDRFSEEAILGAASSCTMLFGVPTMYHRLANTGRAGELAALRLCVSGSAPLSVELWQRLADDGVQVLERYGMSETMLTLSNPLHGQRRSGSVGTPLPGVEASIDQPDEDGVGELFVRGPSLCRGFWARPEASAAMWVDGWFATGDLASVDDDGYVAIRGRRTEMIITGGHNVYPAEVEAVLSRHPSVAELAVVGVASSEWGESVEAFVVGAGGHAPDLTALAELAEQQLSPHKRPRQFHVLEALPRNAMGKVLRRQLGS